MIVQIQAIINKRNEVQQGVSVDKEYLTKWGQKVVCSCKALNEPHSIFCRICGIKVDLTSMQIIKNKQSFEYSKCTLCHQLTPIPSNKCKYCTACGKELR